MMKNFMHNLKYLVKSVFVDKDVLFWIILYPIILSSFFYFSLNSIGKESASKINVGLDSKNEYSYIFKQVDIFNLLDIKKGEENSSLKNNKIDAFVDEKLNIKTSSNTVNYTFKVNVVESVVRQIKEMQNLNIPIEKYDFNANYFSSKNAEVSPIKFFMYSLLAMYMIYGYFMTCQIYSLYQGNLSAFGARVSVSPISKYNKLFVPFVFGFLVNIFSNILLILVITYIYGISIIQNLPYTAIILISANILGLSLGALISVTNKLSLNAKTGLGVGISLFLAFLTGMMNNQMKSVIEGAVPFISKINPVALGMDALYGVNVLNDTKILYENVGLMLVSSLVILSISFVFMNRGRYESI
ncbi:ABC transporter permease [Helcococcus bovis]|uniref:ABC transporter permease n=1 Tax=Helcococcus bovis TaxID=3153252 RepID=UPI0038B89E7B